MSALGPFLGTLTDPAGNKAVYAPDGLHFVLVDEPAPPPEPDPEPEPVDPLGTAWGVRIGRWAYPIAGVNPTSTSNPLGAPFPGARGRDQLVAYRAPVLRTETNQWGREVVVDAGRVVAVGVNQTAVPASGYVLSGHGAAEDGLHSNAVVGAVVELLDERPASDTAPAPTPSGSAVPAWVVGGYWQQYEGPTVAAVTAEAPEYNVLFAAFATGGGGQAMQFAPVIQDEASFVRDVAASKAHGARWVLSIGGGVKANAATVLRTEAEAVRCYDALAPIIDRCGFDGVDDDLENGPGGFTEAGLTALFRRLRDNYGPGFILSSTPRPYESFRKQIAANLYEAGLLDLLQWQFYDAPEYRDATYLRGRVMRELDAANALGVPYSAQVIGAITRRGYQYGWNTVDTYAQIVADMKASRGVRGAFVWHTQYDRAEGWSFARRIGALGA